MAVRLIGILRMTCIGILLLLAAAFLALRQPTLVRVAYAGHARADAARLQRDVRFFTTFGARDAAHPESLDIAASYIANEFRAAGASVSEQIFVARKKTYRNVIADFGDDGHSPLLIVGAHYDAFSSGRRPLPGADDNASGTAGLLELARLLGKQRPARNVMLVAFANEEPPFFGSDEMGSAVHAAATAASGRTVDGMICLEMIGYFTPRQHWDAAILRLLYPHRGDFVAVAGGWNDRALTRAVKQAIAGAGAEVVSVTAPHDWLDASDQRSYWARRWPAVMVTDTAYERNPNYHTVRDTAETLDYGRMAGVVDGVFNATLCR